MQNDSKEIKNRLKTANEFLDAGDLLKAEWGFLGVLKTDPKNLDAHYKMLLMRLAEEKYDEARFWFKRLDAIDSTYFARTADAFWQKEIQKCLG
jgi:Tfp pilus assembly protein PilF